MSGRLSKIEDWEQLAKEAKFRPGQVAALCGVSDRQLERYFKERFNTTPGQWLRRCRCRFAQALIAQGFASKAVAADLHFASSAHFCREFKKEFGSAPQDFSPVWSNGQKCRL